MRNVTGMRMTRIVRQGCERRGLWQYRLELPPDIKIYHVFHISLLNPTAEDPYPGQHIPLLPPVEVDGDQEWHIEEVFDSKMIQGRLKYLVKWIGYEADWQPAENFNRLQAVEDFRRRYPNKPGPLPNDDN